MINNRQDSNQKLFVLCIGAQKSGTSWLHQLLSRSRDTDMGFLKEYKSLRKIKLSIREELARRARDRKKFGLLGFESSMPSFKQFLQLNNRDKQVLMSIDNCYYYDYFDFLVSGVSGAFVTGDFSPHYCELTKKCLSSVRQRLVKRGFRVKIIYLMRDPVERVSSQIRMIRRDGTKQEICACSSEVEAISKFYKSAKVACHTRYEYPLDAIQNAFPREDVLIEFFERLFSYVSYNRIQSFLGISLPIPCFFERVNATFKAEFISTSLKSRVAYEYAQTYSIVHKNFGENIFELWPNANLVRPFI